MAVLRADEELAKIRSSVLSLSTTLSSSFTYIWLLATRDGMRNEKPSPRMIEETARRQISSISAVTSSDDIFFTSFETPTTPTSSSVLLREAPT
eukprot:scaffold8701_cov28-Tisochrysis_lutea.AAC.1